MNSPRPETSPSPEQTGQAGQDQLNQQDQFVGGIQDPSKLAPELQEAYKNMQADYTRKTQEIANQRKELESRQEQLVASRDKAEMLDTLYADPGFQQWVVSRGQGGQQAQGQGQQQDVSFRDRIVEAMAEFEGADAFASAFEMLRDDLRNYVDNGFTQHLTPVVQQAQMSAAEREFQGLRDWAQQNNLTDPQVYRESIDIYRRKYPNVGVRDAYNMVVGSRSTDLTTRPAINRGANQSAAGAGQPAGQQPSQQGAGESVDTGNPDSIMRPGGTAVVGSGAAPSKTALDQALENSGLTKAQDGSTGRSIDMVLEKVMDDINARGGDISREDVFGRGG